MTITTHIILYLYMKNKKGENMKTKKIQNGWYEIEINNNVYDVQKNLADEHFGDWNIKKVHFSPISYEPIDICVSLKEAKEVIKMIEERA